MKIRAFQPDDIEPVVAMFVEIFRSGETPRRDVLATYFDEVYFHNPWYDGTIDSVVCEESDGGISAFLGAIPRPMKIHGQSVQAAIVGNYMVQPDRTGSSLAAVELMREFLTGPQDLTLSDTAGDPARKIMELCGGSASRLYSFDWVRPLRPASVAIGALQSRGGVARIALLARPAGWLLDTTMRLLPRGPFRRSEVESSIIALEVTTMIEGLQKMNQYTLKPHYEPRSLTWLLDAAGRKQDAGELRARAVVSADNLLKGWFIYYRKPGAVSEVLQLVSDPFETEEVVRCLLRDADLGNSTAVSGRLDPWSMKPLSAQHARMRAESWTLVHAKDEGLYDPFLRGEALFSGLEGEHWMRFVGDPFER